MPKALPGSSTQVSSSLWKQGLAELVGSFVFTFVSAAAVVSSGKFQSEQTDSARVLAIAVTEGFAFYAIVNLTMRLASGFGGYFNPALTLALTALDIKFDRRVLQHTWRFVFFLVAQLAGATGGAFFTLLALPDPLSGEEKTGVSRPPNHGTVQATNVQAFVIEALLGLFFTLVVFSVRRNEKRRSSLVLALGYTAVRIVSIPLSGGYINPARSFASGVVGGGLDILWVYLFGAPAGALVGVMCFSILHSDDMEVDDVFQNADADDDEY